MYFEHSVTCDLLLLQPGCRNRSEGLSLIACSAASYVIYGLMLGRLCKNPMDAGLSILCRSEQLANVIVLLRKAKSCKNRYL